jgi:anti-anti-sigma factor
LKWIFSLCNELQNEKLKNALLTWNKEIKMAIKNWSEDTILVDLLQEPQMKDELEVVLEIVHNRGNCDVVIDFSGVDIVTSSSMSKLLKIRKILSDNGHKLVLCSVTPATKGIFIITGIDGNFDFAGDKSQVLECL